MAWNSTDLPGATIANVDSAQVFPLGTVCKARNAAASTGWVGEFIYMKGVASAAAGKWAALNYDDYGTALLPDGHVGPVGLFMSSLIASTFGWVQIKGKGSGLLAASVADNAALYTTATAGQGGATASSQSEIVGARAAAASGSSAANTDVEIDYPKCCSLVGA
jgi:hypothetical protein